MMLFVRLLLGALLAAVVLWGSVAVYGLVAVWSPFPRTWWAHHMPWVMFGSEALVLLPCILFLGFALSKLYKQYAVIYAFISTTVAVLIAFGSSFSEPAPLDRWMAGYFGAFWIGPPLLLLLVRRLRSNNRWRGP